MDRKMPPRLTPAELEIMDVVWTLGETTVSEVMRQVNAERENQLTRSTIQTQVFKLKDKGWLTYREVGNRFCFSAAFTRDQASAEVVDDLKTRFFGGSCLDLIRAAFNVSELTPEELKKIRELVDGSGK